MNTFPYALLIFLSLGTTAPGRMASFPQLHAATPSAIRFNPHIQEMAFIGEIKGRSYIKIIVHPVKNLSATFDDETEATLSYRGSYYESVSGKKYVLTASFVPQLREWTFRCFNVNNQAVYLFKGKQKPDGSIEGNWKSNRSTHSFYLRPS